MLPELKLIAAGLVLVLFLILPLLLYRAGRGMRVYVLPFLPLTCAGLLAVFEPGLLYPAAQLLFVVGAYIFFIIGVGGALHVELRFAPTPRNNTIYLGLCSLAACVLGGIGATLVFLGPLVRMNQARRRFRHIPIFFLIAVTNLGGLISPVGSVHLYVLHSMGVPGAHFLQLLPFWLGSMTALLLVFFAYDVFVLSDEPIQTDPRLELHDNLYRALQSHRMPQSLLLRTIDYLETPKAMFQGGAVVFLLPIGLGAVVFAERFGNAYLWRECVLLTLGGIAFVAARSREPSETARSVGPMLGTSLQFFACVAFVFLPLWSRSLAVAGPMGRLVTEQSLFALLQALSGWIDGTAALLGALSTRLPQGGTAMASVLAVPPAWKAILADPRLFWLLALVPALTGGLTYASDQANLIGRRISEWNGIVMPGFFAHFTVALPITLLVALPSAILYRLLAP